MKLVFVHGWGLDAKVWDEMVADFPEYECIAIDLGFTTRCEMKSVLPKEDYIAIGHSMGVMWLLRHQTPHMKALISICGFDNFAKYVPAKILRGMRRRLDSVPYEMMCDFWPAPYVAEDQLQVEALKEGLDHLRDWSAEDEHAGLTCPVLALAARGDMVVPKEMTTSIWGDQVKWVESDSHFLPIVAPDWCAEQIKDFVNGTDF